MFKPLGFFRELDPQVEDDSAPSIHDAVRPHGLDDESGILAYLSSGTEIYTTMGADRDVISRDEWVPGAGSLVTDGTWLWPVELRHYVKRYHVELPEEFLATVRSMRYTAPAVPRARAREIFDEAFGRTSHDSEDHNEDGSGGFFSFYLSELNPKIASSLLKSLETAGLNAWTRLSREIFLRPDRNRAGDPPLLRDEQELADLLASPGGLSFALHLWHSPGISTVMRLRRLEDSSVVLTYELRTLHEPEREEVVAALVRALDQLRDHCRGFVLDRTGNSSPDASWDPVICNGASPTAPLPDSLAVDTSRFTPPSGLGSMTPTSYGHLTVYSKSPAEGGGP
ncbi:hypothetical protein ABZ532_16895 [Streptomyces sp. NPDC019396]|uniref:hypothetical protein n=1 Tax=Streptomyces sp. NPDC019396 TaxID=3154687 RepID=UPI0033EE5ECD